MALKLAAVCGVLAEDCNGFDMQRSGRTMHALHWGVMFPSSAAVRETCKDLKSECLRYSGWLGSLARTAQ